MRNNLVVARGEKSQQEVANALNISQKTLSALERGYRNPSVDLMKKLQGYYKISMIKLFEDIFTIWYYILLYVYILIQKEGKVNGWTVQKYLSNSERK